MNIILDSTDPMAQDLLAEYAKRKRSTDPTLASDLETALMEAGYFKASPKSAKADEKTVKTDG